MLCAGLLPFSTCTQSTNGSVVSLVKLSLHSAGSIQTLEGKLNACRASWAIYNPVQSGGSDQTCKEHLNKNPHANREER